MLGRTKLICAVLVASFPLLMAGADSKMSAPNLTAAQIVEKNVAARGGLAAWRAVQGIELSGKMQAGGNNRSSIPVPGTKSKRDMLPVRPAEQAQLPFVMDLQRPRKMRLEVQFNGQTALQVYDGMNGWKLRPFLNRHQVETFTPEELKAASAQADLDGLLIDYAAKGSKVELEGVDKVDDRAAYKLKVTDKAGNARHVWVDAESFLETKIEGAPRRLDGKYHPVATYLRDYRSFNGLVMPYVLVTTVEGIKDTEQITIEKVVLNPKFEAARFSMPR